MTNRLRDRHKGIKTEIDSCNDRKSIKIFIDRQEGRSHTKQMDRQMEGQTNRQRDRHKGRQRDRLS